MRKLSFITALTIIVGFALSVFSTDVQALNFAPPFDVYSEAVYMVNLDTGEVIFKKSENTQLVPASLTKIMTAVVVLDEYKNKIGELSTTYVKATSEAFDELYLTGCSNADIRIGESVNYKDLLYALMLRSACESANIIALDMADSLQGFVNLMNAKAEELGLENTHFSNAHGLFPTDNYTTASDMAKLTMYALELPLFMEISSAVTYEMEATSFHEKRTISHTNYMMSPSNGGEYYYEYVKGIKTGTLDEAGRCLVTTASKDGYTYLLVTLKAPQQNSAGENVFYNFIDHKNLYEWAFENFSYTQILNKNEEIASVSVAYGDKDTSVNLKPSDEYSQIWLNSLDISTIQRVITKDENVVAPVTAGQKLGTVELRVSGETMAVIDLVAVKTIERDRTKELITVAKNFTHSKHFKTALGISIGIFVLYTGLFIAYLNARYQRKRRKYSAPKGRTPNYRSNSDRR